MPRYRNRHRTQADLDIGNHLANERVAKGLTQSELAERMAAFTGAPWSQVTVSNLERGRTPLTVVQWCQLSTVLGDEAALPITPRSATTPCIDLPDDNGERPRIGGAQ